MCAAESVAVSRVATAPPAEAEKALLTAEDLWSIPRDGRRYELVKGELVEMTPVL